MLQKDYFLRLVEEFAQALIWLQNKKDRDQILVVVNREAPVASSSHILRKLNKYGYEMTFGYTILQGP